MAIGWKSDYLRYKDFFLNVLSVYNTKPNLKIYMELVMSLFAILIFSLFAIKPTILTVISLNKEIKEKEKVSINLKQKIKNLQIANNLMQSQNQNLQYLQQAIPSSANPDITIKQIQSLATNNSIQILGINISDVILLGVAGDVKKTRDVETLKIDSAELPFSFTATGSYTDILKFIINIEQMRQPVKIDTLSINSNTTDKGKIIILTVSARVPFLLEDK